MEAAKMKTANGLVMSVLSDSCDRLCGYRFSPAKRRYIFAIVAFGLVTFLYYRLNLVNYAWYNQPSRLPTSCQIAKHEINELTRLSHDVHSILKRLNVTHWLTYGSLWGAIRYQAPVPWDNDVDIGVLRGDIQSIAKGRLAKEFSAVNVKVHYSYWGGFYRLTRGTVRADLMVFEESADNIVMQRVGIEAYVFFINYRRMHTFPAELVRKPLPKQLFGGVALPVPHGGAEIQKYHYPYDWWKENRPSGC